LVHTVPLGWRALSACTWQQMESQRPSLATRQEELLWHYVWGFVVHKAPGTHAWHCGPKGLHRWEGRYQKRRTTYKYEGWWVQGRTQRVKLWSSKMDLDEKKKNISRRDGNKSKREWGGEIGK
jgi:hypothetical protein